MTRESQPRQHRFHDPMLDEDITAQVQRAQGPDPLEGGLCEGTVAGARGSTPPAMLITTAPTCTSHHPVDGLVKDCKQYKQVPYKNKFPPKERPNPPFRSSIPLPSLRRVHIRKTQVPCQPPEPRHEQEAAVCRGPGTQRPGNSFHGFLVPPCLSPAV